MRFTDDFRFYRGLYRDPKTKGSGRRLSSDAVRKLFESWFNGVRYTNAPLDSIICQVRDLLREHGFSFRFSRMRPPDSSGPEDASASHGAAAAAAAAAAPIR